MTDRATAVAAFLAEEQDGSQEPDALWDEMRRRWPGLTPEEGRRSAAIAAEILGGKIAEESVQAEAMADALSRANGDDAALRAEMAAAVQVGARWSSARSPTAQASRSTTSAPSWPRSSAATRCRDPHPRPTAGSG